MDTSEKLNLLAAYRQENVMLQEQKQAIIDSLMTEEIKQKLSEIDAEFAPKFRALTDKTNDVETEIKRDVIAAGSTIKGRSLMAVFNKGRVSWDAKGLEGFAVAHPEMLAFRSTGEPSVTIRINGKGE